VRALAGEPYHQLLSGEEVFRHALPFDRSSMTRCRQRMARWVREQRPGQRNPKIYSLHAPEVEYTDKAKAH
jgi:hypothetical protein